MARGKSKSVDLAVEAVADRASDAAKAKAGLDKLKGFKRAGSGSKSDVEEVIPSSMEVLNKHVLGCGGWPVKRAVEVFSDPSAGKTSLLIDALGNCAKLGGVPVMVETERALQLERFKVLGCDPDDVWLSEPMSAEEAIDAMRLALTQIPKGTGPNLLGLDSIGMSDLAEVMEKGRNAKTLGRKAALNAEHMPPIARLCSETRTCLFMINHISTKIGVMFGDPTTTPGGDKNKFIASIRLRLWAGSKVKVGDTPVGIMPTAMTVKNKLAIPNRKAKLRLMWETGWDDGWTTLNFAKDLKKVEKDLKLTPENVQRARAALGWYTPTDAEKAEWAAADAAAAEKAKNKSKRGKKAVQEELDIEDVEELFELEDDGEEVE